MTIRPGGNADGTNDADLVARMNMGAARKLEEHLDSLGWADADTEGRANFDVDAVRRARKGSF